MKRVLGARARLDIDLILSASGERFGREVRRRYRLLLSQAINDAVANPKRAGVGQIGPHAAYHTRHARPRTPPGHRIARPRHVIVFRVVGDAVHILRVLHDAMDLPEHLRDT